LSSIRKPTEVCKPLLCDEDVQPYVLMMFSQAPPMPQVLGGLQELRKVPSIIANWPLQDYSDIDFTSCAR